MRYLEYKQAVIANSVEEYNKLIKEFAENKPEERIDFTNGEFHALIMYTVRENIPETVRDEYILKGHRYTCRSCPLHDPIEDARKRHVGCMYADYGEADLKGECCEVFYRKLARGEIKVVE